MIPTIKKPGRVTQKTTTAIDHILTNSFTNTVFKTVTLKSDIFGHFLICFVILTSVKQTEKLPSYLKVFDTESI